MESPPLIVLLIIVFFAVGYVWLRFGPKRCPNCGKFTWGVMGPHIGIRRVYFKCENCGTKFEGHKRLPL